MKVIRVLVVDDSVVCCEILASVINQAPDCQVVGQASRGKEAIELTRKLSPDLITMDIHMPGMNGFATIEEIMATHPVPILVVTSAPIVDGVDQTYRAISSGALDLVRKPELNDEEAANLIEKIRLLAGIRVIRHRRPLSVAAPNRDQPRRRLARLAAIASSTGGPKVLVELLGQLPHKLDLAFLLTQHLPDGFSAAFTSWLNNEVPFEVREASEGDRVRPGVVLVAPGGCHMEVKAGEVVHLSSAPPVHSHRPSADPMFESVAEVFGRSAIGVVLTGMGRDGSAGLLKLKRAGGLCLAQDEASSLIYGMPRAAVEIGAADQVLDIPGLAAAILSSAQTE